MLRKKKGQNTLEYIIILTVVISAVVAFVAIMKGGPTSPGGPGSSGVGQLLNKAGAKIGDSSGKIVNMTK